MLKLGVKVKDKASGMNGSLLSMLIQDGGNRWYNFQPAALDKETGKPVERTWITATRVDGEEIPDPDLPLDALGTEAEDTITGFRGQVISLILHVNGCVHVELQPKGTDGKTGGLREAAEFDIRLLKGKKIPKFTESELVKSKKDAPSPAPSARMRFPSMAPPDSALFRRK